MTTFLLMAGPPASGALWSDVVARLEQAHGLDAQVHDPFAEGQGDASLPALVDGLVSRIRSLGDDVVLVGHGTAVPVVWRAAVECSPLGLVLSNGPVHTLDPVLNALSKAARSPGLLARTVLRPEILQRWLASSAGLRRTVVNPYVMDRDTVVRISDPILATPEHRLKVARYLAELSRLPNVPPAYEGRTLLFWGDGDPLYTAATVDEARRWLPNADHLAVPGGQHFHPVERPWFMADALAEYLSTLETGTAPQSAAS